MENRIQRQILTLERVYHLVRQYQPKLQPIRPGHAEERSRVGVVIAGYLLTVQVYQQWLESQGIRQEAEQAIRGLDAVHPGRGKLLVKLIDQICPHLFPASLRRSGRVLELESRRSLDRWLEAVYQPRHVVL